MAATILKGVGKLVGIGGKKKAADPAAATTTAKGPVITQMPNLTPELRRRLGKAQLQRPVVNNINSTDRLGA